MLSDLQSNVSIAFVAFTGATAAITTLVLVFLCIQCCRFYTDDDKEMRETLYSRTSRTEGSRTSLYFGNRSHERSEFSTIEIRHIFTYRKRVMVLTSLLLLMQFPLWNLPFAVFGIPGKPLPAEVLEYAFLTEMCLGIGTAFLFTGLWVFAYIFYDALPDIKTVSSILEVNTIFAKYPNCKHFVFVSLFGS